ncbi:zinc-binding dehydrogenase [Baekduia soli]|uniref:Zinc-binding dehydrogenase n=1 Tax=Baekduia soli TaxID=496014 RepID=A0A5B8U3P1_9ACTN|nr:alcohol dehydrogenase catalytic domain-containing protein [Baekduia soli]QEC47541.1 zinc-binding dehydrogenase [Baekduia soli]
MRALVTSAPRTMELREVDAVAEPGPGEVLLGIDAVGICGSDFGLYKGTHPYAQFPQVQGHEFCGTVRALGPGCEGTHAVGTRVAVEPLLPCGHCYPCSVGRGNCCMELRILGVHTPGGLQDELVVPERLLHDADGLDAPAAAFAEPMSIALQGLVRAQVVEGDTVLVLGAGPIGQAAIIAARALGARAAASDLVPERLERATAVGAELVFDAAGDVPDALGEWTHGVGPTVVVDATGAPVAIRRAVDLVSFAGRVVVIGLSSQEVSLPIVPFTRKEISILGSRNSVGIFGDAVRIVRDHPDEVARLITHEIALEDVPETIELAMAHPEIVEKAIVRMAA